MADNFWFTLVGKTIIQKSAVVEDVHIQYDPNLMVLNENISIAFKI